MTTNNSQIKIYANRVSCARKLDGTIIDDLSGLGLNFRVRSLSPGPQMRGDLYQAQLRVGEDLLVSYQDALDALLAAAVHAGSVCERVEGDRRWGDL